MFKNKGGDEVETIIGPSVQVEGNFVANGDIVIEGSVSGSIKTAQNLRIGENARIFASVAAANAVIAGEVQGNVKIQESLELTQNAKIFGDIRAKVISVAAGASIHGKCLVGVDKKTRLEKLGDHEKLIHQNNEQEEKGKSTPEKVK